MPLCGFACHGCGKCWPEGALASASFAAPGDKNLSGQTREEGPWVCADEFFDGPVYSIEDAEEKGKGGVASWGSQMDGCETVGGIDG